MIVCICLIGGNDECDNSQDSLNKKEGTDRMDIAVASSLVVPPTKESEGKASEPKGKEYTGSMPTE